MNSAPNTPPRNNQCGMSLVINGQTPWRTRDVALPIQNNLQISNTPAQQIQNYSQMPQMTLQTPPQISQIFSFPALPTQNNLQISHPQKSNDNKIRREMRH